MLELTQEQRQELDRGDPVLTEVGGRDVVVLRRDMHRQIERVIDMERALIHAGHTRGPVEAPEPLTPLSVNGTEDYVVLDAARLPEIRENVAALREEQSWLQAVAATRGQMLRDDAL
jgi:hypothetical protein